MLACEKMFGTRSVGALRASNSSWRPFGPLNFILRALRAVRLVDPCVRDWIVCSPLDSVLARFFGHGAGAGGITYSRSEEAYEMHFFRT